MTILRVVPWTPSLTGSEPRMQWHCIYYCKYYLKERKSKVSLRAPKGKLAEAPSTPQQRPNVDTLVQAEREIIHSVQHEHIEEEIRTLRSLNVDGEFMDGGAAKQRAQV